VACGENADVIAANDPSLSTLLGKLSGMDPLLSDATQTLAEACAPSCLRDSTCYANGVGQLVDALTLAFPDDATATTWIANNPNVATAQISFTSGLVGTADPTSKAIEYVVRVNETAFGDEENAFLTQVMFAERWGTDANRYALGLSQIQAHCLPMHERLTLSFIHSSNFWRRGAHVLRIHTAVDGALIDTKDGGAEYSVNLDVSIRAYPYVLGLSRFQAPTLHALYDGAQ
jgi:hypothetical protein|tara:strand:- start:7142 stop:7834 length:693 start_codon:yes stop_codon:yes gene_type:complete